MTLMGNSEGKSIRESSRSVGLGTTKGDAEADMQCFQFNSAQSREGELCSEGEVFVSGCAQAGWAWLQQWVILCLGVVPCDAAC